MTATPYPTGYTPETPPAVKRANELKALEAILADDPDNTYWQNRLAMTDDNAALKERERTIYRVFAEEPVTAQAAAELIDELAEIIARLSADGDTVIDDMGDYRLCQKYGVGL